MEEKVINKLFELQDLKYKDFQSNLCPNIKNIIGVRIPILRKYAKELIVKYSLADLLNNIEDNYYEEIMLKGMLIGLAPDLDMKTLIRYIKGFVPKIDNWAVCDVFCGGLKIAKKYKKEIWKLICEYAKSEKEFEVRFAIVMILDYYIEDEYLEQDFQIFNNVKNEAYYSQMAVAWAISICLVKYYDITVKWLQSSKCKLDKFTFNKAIQKAIESYRITDEQKQYLRRECGKR